jgi:hypothetical protein
MEFIDKHQNPTQKCMVCLNPAWIKIKKVENHEIMEKFLCLSHYIEHLEEYLEGKLDESIILFDKKSKMLEIPLYEAIERFGGTNEPELLNNYIKYINQKIENIHSEINQSNDTFFIALLKNEKQDKELRKLLAQARIKYFNF